MSRAPLPHLGWNFGSRHGALGFNSPVIYDVLFHRESLVHARRAHVRDEAKPSRAPRHRILHNDSIRYLAELLEVALECLIGRLERETADENFAAGSVDHRTGDEGVSQCCRDGKGILCSTPEFLIPFFRRCGVECMYSSSVGLHQGVPRNSGLL